MIVLIIYWIICGCAVMPIGMKRIDLKTNIFISFLTGGIVVPAKLLYKIIK